MGHNDIDYENKTNKELSFQFANEIQNRFILDSILWLGEKRKIAFIKTLITYWLAVESVLLHKE
jgi:hypothetical protein